MISVERGRWLFEAWHDYDSFLPRANWRDFCFVNLAVEWNNGMGHVEGQACILGLHVRALYIYGERESFLPASAPRREDAANG